MTAETEMANHGTINLEIRCNLNLKNQSSEDQRNSFSNTLNVPNSKTPEATNNIRPNITNAKKTPSKAKI